MPAVRSKRMEASPPSLYGTVRFAKGFPGRASRSLPDYRRRVGHRLITGGNVGFELHRTASTAKDHGRRCHRLAVGR